MRIAGGRIDVEQRHDDHRRLEVVRDQAADEAGLRDVLAQLLEGLLRPVVGVGHDRAAGESFLGHLGIADHRHPDRLHPGPVDARREEQLVVHLAQRLEERGIENVALRGLDDHPQRVAEAAQLALVRQVVLDVRVRRRQHLLVAGIEADPGRHEAQHDRDHQADEHHRHAVVEDEPLEPVAGLQVEVLEVADDRHRFDTGRWSCHGFYLGASGATTITPNGPVAASRSAPA